MNFPADVLSIEDIALLALKGEIAEGHEQEDEAGLKTREALTRLIVAKRKIKGPTEEQLKVVVPAPYSKLGIQNQNILADSSATNGQQNVPTHPSKDLKNTDEDINDVLADTRASNEQQQDTQEDIETMLNDPETSKKKFQNEAIQLWGGECSNDIVAVMDTQGNMVLGQEEFLTLKPHNWLNGDIIAFYLAMFASGTRVYHLDHFLTWAIMKGKRDIMSRQLLSKVTFEDYDAAVGCFNTGAH
ncbi:hypothetical protein SKAU_G00138070 [Synaphobranchus kaupii]|uniref:Uncharacterized protein n=1 Tax=Synaphobranchus kaupii TaxID=118154 RepID=A0A9Q1FRQ1_SYNKA|nr:hypothetical protein SKAU_G00138070 [Synaphobranchus kaupii]